MKSLVIGYGSIGKRHIENLSKLKNIQISVCTKRKMDNFLRKKNCKLFDSLDDAISDMPDFAIICNETNLHNSTSIKLAEAGIHMFIEKPISNSFVGYDHLSKIVKKKKLITMVGCNMRFHECIQTIKKLLDKKTIGRVITVRSESGSFLPDWHPYENYQISYAAQKKLGGGVILTCIHEVDYLHWFFGDIKTVFSFNGKYSDLKIDVEDLAVALLKFKNTIVGEIHLNFLQKPEFRSCKIIGTHGIIYWDSETNTVKVYDTNKEKWVNKLTLRKYDRNLMYIKELEYFLNSLYQNKEPMNNVKNNANVLKTALGMINSSKLNRVVKI